MGAISRRAFCLVWRKNCERWLDVRLSISIIEDERFPSALPDEHFALVFVHGLFSVVQLETITSPLFSSPENCRTAPNQSDSIEGEFPIEFALDRVESPLIVFELIQHWSGGIASRGFALSTSRYRISMTWHLYKNKRLRRQQRSGWHRKASLLIALIPWRTLILSNVSSGT